MKENATVTVEKINPAQARVWLNNRHSGQRPMRDTWVERLAEDMKEGKFQLSTDAVLLVANPASPHNNSYTLANGQHRLAAVVASGVSCEFIVMRTSDQSIYEVIDCGIKRSVGDVIAGEHATCVAAIAAWCCSYNEGKLTIGAGGGSRTSRTLTVDFAKKNRAVLQDVAAAVKSLYGKSRFLSTSMAGALMFLADQEHPGKGREFVQHLYIGGDIPVVINDVRNKIINNKLSRSRVANTYLFGLMIKSFNSWLKGTRPGNLVVNPGEAYPQIVTKAQLDSK